MAKRIRQTLNLALILGTLGGLADLGSAQASRMPPPGSSRKPSHYMGPFGQVSPGPRTVEPPAAPPTLPPSPPPSTENPPASATAAAGSTRGRGARSGGVGRRRRGASAAATARWETWWEWNKECFLGLGRRHRLVETTASRGPLFLGRCAETSLSRRQTLRGLHRTIVLPALRRANAAGGIPLRVASVYALGFTGEREVLPDLVAALADDNLGVREAALSALGMCGDREAAAVLVEVLRGRRPGAGEEAVKRTTHRERGLAALGLGLLGDVAAIEPLRRVTFRRGTSHELRGACLLALGMIRDGESRQLLGRALKASWCGVRERAWIATALGYQGANEVLIALSRLMRDDAAEVRRAAVLAVGSFPRQETLRRSLAEARTRLEGEGLSEFARQRLADYVTELRATIARAREDEAPVWGRLRSTLHHLMNRDADHGVRAFATVALGQVGDMTDAGAIGRRLVRGEHGICGFAILALGLLARDHEDRREPLLERLRHRLEKTKDPGLKGAYFVALGLGGDTLAAEKLLAALDRRSPPSLRGYAATGLGLLRDPRHAAAVARSLVGAKDLEEIQNTAVGLSLVGGAAEVTFLTAVLRASRDTHEQIAVASGLAFLGGQNALSALAGFLRAEGKPTPARAFVAEGLGLAVDFSEPTALARITSGYDFLLRLGPVDRVADLKW